MAAKPSLGLENNVLLPRKGGTLAQDAQKWGARDDSFRETCRTKLVSGNLKKE